jgi:hypothetical protein
MRCGSRGRRELCRKSVASSSITTGLLAHHHVSMDCSFSELLHVGELSYHPLDEVLEPARHIHTVVAHALKGLMERLAVPEDPRRQLHQRGCGGEVSAKGR